MPQPFGHTWGRLLARGLRIAAASRTGGAPRRECLVAEAPLILQPAVARRSAALLDSSRAFRHATREPSRGVAPRTHRPRGPRIANKGLRALVSHPIRSAPVRRAMRRTWVAEGRFGPRRGRAAPAAPLVSV